MFVVDATVEEKKSRTDKTTHIESRRITEKLMVFFLIFYFLPLLSDGLWQFGSSLLSDLDVWVPLQRVFQLSSSFNIGSIDPVT